MIHILPNQVRPTGALLVFRFFFPHTFLFNSPLATKIIEKTKSQPSDQQQWKRNKPKKKSKKQTHCVCTKFPKHRSGGERQKRDCERRTGKLKGEREQIKEGCGGRCEHVVEIFLGENWGCKKDRKWGRVNGWWENKERKKIDREGSDFGQRVNLCRNC